MMKKNFTNPMVAEYLAPEVEILAISVEKGFAISGDAVWGEEGEAGQGIGGENYGDFE